MSEKNQTVIVLGAGVIGVTAAYYLARAGLKVTVIDRQPGPGLETSYANGGQISACHSEPWAGPSVLPKIVKWLGRADAPLLFRLRADPALWSWSLKFLANCTERSLAGNMERMLRVALMSRQALIKLRAETGIQYDQLSVGILHIYGNSREYARARRQADRMNGLGLFREPLSARQCVGLEPALQSALSRGLLAGGIYSAADESGDAYAFTTKLAALAVELGVNFQYGRSIDRLIAHGASIDGVACGDRTFTAAHYVMALGSYSPLLLKPLGIRVPVYPAKGYSATLPINKSSLAPTVSLIQDEKKLVYSRLGNRLRIAGTAELAGYDTSLNQRRAGQIVAAALELFPGAGEAEEAELWAGLRPATPDGAPIIGPTPYSNLILNTGHGTLGWTMACGSARIVSDLVQGLPPEIAIDGLGYERF